MNQQLDRQTQALSQLMQTHAAEVAASSLEQQQRMDAAHEDLREELKSLQARLDVLVDSAVFDLQNQLQDLNSRVGALNDRIITAEKPASGGGQASQAAPAGGSAAPSSDKMLFGQSEWVAFPKPGLVLRARIDSGASTSSLHARDLQEFERDGRTWVRFYLAHKLGKKLSEKEMSSLKVEAPLVRRTGVKQASGTVDRPVVSLPMQIGPLTQEVEFTLTDRDRLTYPVLLGRRFFMDIAVVDVAKEYQQPKPKLESLGKDSGKKPAAETAAAVSKKAEAAVKPNQSKTSAQNSDIPVKE